MLKTNAKYVVITNWRDLKHPQAGGAELVCDEMAAQFIARGHQVVLLCAKVSGQGRLEVRNNYLIRRAGGTFTVYLWALAWLLLNRRRITAVLDSQNGIPFFTPLVLGRSTPILLLLHHIHQQQFSQHFSRPAAALGRWLESTACRAVYGQRAIVAVSPSTRHGARTQLGLKGDITIIPPGWRLSAASLVAAPARAAKPQLVAVGRLVPHKRVHLSVEAMATIRLHHPDAELHIVGNGPELATLRALVISLSLQSCVHFHTDCDDMTRDELVSASWLSLNASSGEGWGISVIESNALGTPVLAFDRPGLKDSIQHGQNGWLIPDGTALGAAAADLIERLADVDFARQVSERSRRWAQNFTWDHMGRKLLAALSVESERLQRQASERRKQSDLATVVDVPLTEVPVGFSPDLREGDSVNAHEDGLTIFLAGSDTVGSGAVLQRIGLPIATAPATITVRVAGGQDHMAVVPNSSARLSKI